MEKRKYSENIKWTVPVYDNLSEMVQYYKKCEIIIKDKRRKEIIRKVLDDIESWTEDDYHNIIKGI